MNSTLIKVLAVAWRDFKHTALTKAFIIAGIGLPALVLGAVILIIVLFRPNVPPLEGTVAILDPSGLIAAAARHELTPERIKERVQAILGEAREEFGASAQSFGLAEETVERAIPQIDLEVVAFDNPAAVNALKERVRTGEFVALAITADNVLDVHGIAEGSAATADPSALPLSLFLRSGTAPNHTRLLLGVLRDAVVRARAAHSGHSYEQLRALMTRPPIEPIRITETGGETRESAETRMLIPMAFMILLWIATFTSGNQLLTSTIEEKSNRVMEVLLSAVSPMQLMTGKILGQAGVSFVMMAIYAGLGLLGLAAAARADLVAPIQLVYLGLYFIMAYFMIASIMAGIGSAVTELRDAQSLITPAMLVLMIPLVLWLPISENPNGMLATITSFVPPLIPFVMILRVTSASEQPALWQIVASLIVGYASMVAMVWMCAKIFRIGVLMYGKPPSPIELFKWLRYS